MLFRQSVTTTTAGQIQLRKSMNSSPTTLNLSLHRIPDPFNQRKKCIPGRDSPAEVTDSKLLNMRIPTRNLQFHFEDKLLTRPIESCTNYYSPGKKTFRGREILSSYQLSPVTSKVFDKLF